MKLNKIYMITAAAVFMAAACSVVEPESPGVSKPELADPVAGELLVKFIPEVADILERNGLVRTKSGVPSLDEVLAAVEGCTIERVFPVSAETEEDTRAAGLNLWYIVRFSADVPASEVYNRFAALGQVQKTSYNRTIMRAYKSEATPLSARTLAKYKGAEAGTHNDPLFPLQWGIVNRGDLFPGVDGTESKGVAGADVNVQKAWELTTGDPSIIVAVLDEGVFVEHPDLIDNMWVNEKEIWRSKVDNDGNGYAGDVYGYNFVKDTGVIQWDDALDSGHASHVAGVIAAQNGNGIGLSSIAGGAAGRPGVKIMSCQIFSGAMSSNTYNSIRAIKYAADNGAVVLQCSWGYVSGEANVYDWGMQGFRSEEEWARECPLEKEVLDYFVKRAGKNCPAISGGVPVFAAGNENAPQAGFPGAAEYCVSVAATAADFTPATFSNFGKDTRISAPGGDQNYYWEYLDSEGRRGQLGCILSTVPYHVSETGYGYMEGTSMACPHVSGVVALGLSYAVQLRKTFTPEQIREMLYASATPLEPYLTGKKFYYRYSVDVDLVQPMNMELDSYAGKMGAGQVNATAFLNAIAGSGTPVTFPNVFVSLGGETVVAPALYMDGSDFKVTVSDTKVASASVEGHKIVFKGLSAGMTKAVISSGAKSNDFTITVRQGSGEGWL